MVIRYSQTRYGVCEEWEKKEEETKKKGREGRVAGQRGRSPPKIASSDLPQVLDLSHYGHTSIFTHTEQGWHYSKSVSYDPMINIKQERRRIRAELEQIRKPGKRRGGRGFFTEKELKRKIQEKINEARERDRRMAEGRSRSDDEDNMDDELSLEERKYNVLFPKSKSTDKLVQQNTSWNRKEPVVYSNPDPGLIAGPIPLRYAIKGERFTVARDTSEEVVHHTDLIGFGIDVQFVCFYMAGEPHLVFGQILDRLSFGYGHDSNRMIKLMDGLKIRTKPATGAQVRILKNERTKEGRKIIYPDQMNEFGIRTVELIRKSDASRLLGEYLPLEEDENDNIQILRISDEMEAEAVSVEHHAQGYARGRMYTTGLIRCDECEKVFKPDAFCCHSHRRTETIRVVHWGFDPRKWRGYLNICGKDAKNPEKIKRFGSIMSEPLVVKIKKMPPVFINQKLEDRIRKAQKKDEEDETNEEIAVQKRLDLKIERLKREERERRVKALTFVLNLNKDYNHNPPTQFEIGYESRYRLPQKRQTDEDEEEEEEEITVDKTTVEQKEITVEEEDEIQIISEKPAKSSHIFTKDDFLFKAPDLFATPLSRKYTEKAFKTKGLDLDGILPYNKGGLQLPDSFEKTLSSLQSSFLHQEPVSVYRASVESTPFDPLRALLDLFPAKGEKEGVEGTLKETIHTITKNLQLDGLIPCKNIELPPTSTAIVPYLKDHHSLVPASTSTTYSTSAFLPVQPLIKYQQDLARIQRRQEMAAQLDHEMIGLLQQIPVSIATKMAECMKKRDELRDENLHECRNELINTTTVSKQLAAQVRHTVHESDFLYRVCKEAEVTVPNIPPLTPAQTIPSLITPVLPQFSLPPSSQPLALPPPTTSHLLNGGRSLSMGSPIGIRPVPSSMLGQPGPASSSLNHSLHRPIQQQQRVVGQRGRPRGSGGSGYQRKSSMQVTAVEHKQQQEHQMNQMRQLQQLQQLQQIQQLQQQQQTYTVPQAAQMGIQMNGQAMNGTSPSSSLLSFNLGSSSTPVSLSSLFASASLPSTPQLHTPPDYSQQLGQCAADAASIMAKVQLDSSVAGPSGLSTPSATPSNGLQLATSLPSTPQPILDNVQSMLHTFAPEALQQLIMQSTIMEQHQQQQLLLQPDPPPPAPPAVEPTEEAPLVDINLLRTFLSNPTILPPGININQIQFWHDSLNVATTTQ